MVEIRYTLFLKLLVTCCMAPFGYVICAVSAFWFGGGDDVILGVDLWHIAPVLTLAIGILTWLYMSSYKVVFDDRGITIKGFGYNPNTPLDFWSMPSKGEHLIPWDSDEIYEIDASFGIVTFWKPHKTKIGNREAILVNLDQFATNRRNAMRFAAEKIPPHKFTDNARNFLRTWGIWV